MIPHSNNGGEIVFDVRVVPRAGRSQIVGEHDGALRVRIAAPPVDGAANEELIRLLAHRFKVSKSAISILRGHTNRLKQVRIISGDESIRRILGELG